MNNIQVIPSYPIVYRGVDAIPASLQEFVKRSILDAFTSLDVELDFVGKRGKTDLVVTFTSELPWTNIFGETSRPDINGVELACESTIYIGGMKTVRIETGPTSCFDPFPETTDKLGTLITYVSIHETGHGLSLDHTSDTDNFMWDPGTLHSAAPARPLFFVYTVKHGDTLSGILGRYKTRTLDRCHIAPPDPDPNLTVKGVWEHPANKNFGFVAHPTKSGVKGRRANNPDFIYPGEKVALFNFNVKSVTYIKTAEVFTSKKSFTDAQMAQMKQFIKKRSTR